MDPTKPPSAMPPPAAVSRSTRCTGTALWWGRVLALCCWAMGSSLNKRSPPPSASSRARPGSNASHGPPPGRLIGPSYRAVADVASRLRTRSPRSVHSKTAKRVLIVGARGELGRLTAQAFQTPAWEVRRGTRAPVADGDVGVALDQID